MNDEMTKLLHDLRGPLQILLGAVSDAAKGYSLTVEEWCDAAEAGERMGALIDEGERVIKRSLNEV